MEKNSNFQYTYRVVHQGDCLALTGSLFANDDLGWALVRINGDRCSSQTAVTRCRQWESFATEEALRASAESYGGLTE